MQLPAESLSSAGIGWLRRLGTLYAITNRQVMIRHGIVSRKVHSTKVEHVVNVDTQQSVVQRILKVGTVHFDTASSEDYDFDFANIGSPDQLRRHLEGALDMRRAETARIAATDSTP